MTYDLIANQRVSIKNGTIIDIARSIKNKTGISDMILPSEMSEAISTIVNGDGIMLVVENATVSHDGAGNVTIGG